jgi:hypothetical protein
MDKELKELLKPILIPLIIAVFLGVSYILLGFENTVIIGIGIILSFLIKIYIKASFGGKT